MRPGSMPPSTLRHGTIAVAAAGLMVLAGCATQGDSAGRIASLDVDPLLACRAYRGATLGVLATLRADDALSDGHVASVDRWRPVLNDICEVASARITFGERDLLEAGLAALIAIEKEASE